jgi:hypothetical protein
MLPPRFRSALSPHGSWAVAAAVKCPLILSPQQQIDAIYELEETGMSELARVEIEQDVADAAARRAAEEGLTVTAYISLLLRRSFERLPGEESVLAYDHVEAGSEFGVDRESDEDDASYERRSALYGSLFGRRG